MPNTYYVSFSQGNDSTGSGILASPWKTYTHAVANATVSGIILGKGGDLFIEPSYPINVSGTYLTFGQYGAGNPTISGGNAYPIVAFQNTGFSVLSTNLISTQTLNQLPIFSGIINYNATDSITHSEGAIISGCTINGGGGFGVIIKVGTLGLNKLQNIYITNNDISGAIGGGIMAYSAFGTPTGASYAFSNVQILNNNVHDITGWANGVRGGIILYSSDSSISTCNIANNYIYNIHTSPSASGGSFALYTAICDGVIIQNNFATNCRFSALSSADGGAYDIDFRSKNCIVQYNVAYNNLGSSLVLYGTVGFGGNVFRYNVSIDNCATDVGFAMGDMYVNNTYGTGQAVFHNNTVIRSQYQPSDNGAGVNIKGGTAPGTMFLNNCIVVPSGQTAFRSEPAFGGITTDGNYYQSGPGQAKFSVNGTTFTSLAAFSGVSLKDSHSIAGSSLALTNPTHGLGYTPYNIAQLAMQQFSPIIGSHLAGKGIDTQALYGVVQPAVDIVGNPVIAPYSIGAVQMPRVESPYVAEVLKDNPLIYVKLNEPAGSTTINDCTFNLGGTSSSDIIFGQKGIVPSDPGTCGYLNQINTSGAWAHIPTPNGATAGFSIVPNMAVEAWFCPQGVGTNHGFVTIHSNNFNVLSMVLQFSITRELVLTFADRITFNNIQLSTSGLNIRPNETFHVVGNLLGTGTASIWINGNLRGESFYTVQQPITSIVIPSFYVGTDGVSTNSSGPSGYLQHVSIYGCALPSGRILAHYNAGIGNTGGCSILGG